MTAFRINVIGASGSGTSTVGRALAAALVVPHFESDDFYHGPSDPPFQNPRPATERCRMICRDLSPRENWVLSGGVTGWEPYPELDFTGFVFLHVPTAVRIERLRRRETERFGDRIREGGDMFETHREFIAWASRYDAGDVEGKTLARHEAYLQSQRCPVFEFRVELAVREIVERVIQSLGTTRNATRR
jgi:adenylate kinase family enzyme